MNLLVLLAVIVVLAGLLIGQQWMHNQATTRWMRAFSDKQGILPSILEGIDAPAERTPLKGDTRKRVRVSVAGMPWQK